VLRLVCVIQGLFYLVMGLWPLIWMETFVAITGPKADLWLVDTVSVLVLVIAAVLLFAGARRQIDSAVVLLAIGSAAALTIVEGFYALRGTIWSIYLLDAVIELALIVLWAIAVAKHKRLITGSSGSRSSWTAPSQSARGSV
jgi:hypothetical protein